MHIYYILIKSSQKFWVVYVRYIFISEQCVVHSTNEHFIVHSMYYILTNFLFMDTRLQCQDKLNKANEFLRPT